MQRATVTISGFVGADPERFGREQELLGCTLRVGYTPRYFNQTSGQWVNRPTVWIVVKAFRTLAQHVVDSVHKGDPVIVTGSLGAEEWSVNGETRSRLVLEAAGIGHDLSLGTATFVKHSAGRAEHGSAEGTTEVDNAAQTDREPLEQHVQGAEPTDIRDKHTLPWENESSHAASGEMIPIPADATGEDPY